MTEKEEQYLVRLLTSPLYTPKHCFYNGQMIALNGGGFAYYEGYAQNSKWEINFEHGWLVKNGKVFDPTWKDGTEYFGLKIPTEFIRKNVLETGEAQPLFSCYIRERMEECQ